MPSCLSPVVLLGVVLLDSLSSVCPVVLCLMQLSLSEDLGFCSLFYPVHSHDALWDSLSRPMHSGIVCLASQALDWAVAFWDDLSGL